MYGTKLSTLSKDTTLSQWQKEQKQKHHYNPEMYLQPPTIDPWAIGRKETDIVKKNIPSIAKLQFGFSASRRNNKEMNRVIEDQKMIEKARLFQQK